MYPNIPMNTPASCAELLSMYFRQQICGAKGLLSQSENWEPHPHSKYYAIEGTYNKIIQRKEQKIPVRSVAKNDAKKAPIKTCIYHLGQQLNVTGYEGKKIECRNKGHCKKVHENIENMTRKEVRCHQ